MTSDEGRGREPGAQQQERGQGQEARGRRRIVVGVDGSPPSRAALRWAADQAALTGAVVEAVTGWEFTPVYGWSVPSLDPELAAAAEQTLTESVREVLGPEPAVEVHRCTASGNAAQVLLDRAHGADLLVLGNRGHGGFAGALLGSVTQHCVHHADCPVVVIPHGRG
ncbi:universal stress protein [Streptacidiphilus sp. ASG 303]|uniref:universal stress protein n=1 Tax=Streptacidiphilus sp. ASG 303 TaxID=2896847 RepID=UPI001E479812|nr:universal stress protein [Streptacidiphilus sp. ASG 303]MCD0484499.1 universal stress protein [Streptacidiphilus sp. ASG 303]